MKAIWHKVVVLCQCINDVDSLLACLGVWIVALLDHIFELIHGLHLTFLNWGKWKLLEMIKIDRIQSHNASKGKMWISYKHLEKIKFH
jgi:hypothetical protein